MIDPSEAASSRSPERFSLFGIPRAPISASPGQGLGKMRLDEHDRAVATADTGSSTAPWAAALSTRADRARLRGGRRQPPVTRDFELRVLREGHRNVLHAGAVSHLVSTAFLEALFMTTTSPTLQRIVPQNSRAPLWVIGRGMHCDFDEVALAFYAKRMGRDDLAYELMEELADRSITLEQRWAELGGGAVPPDEPRASSGR